MVPRWQSSQRVSILANRSDSLKSYILLNPSGPYFFRSNITPCKKIAPNTSLLKATTFTFTLLSSYSSSIFISEPSMFFLSPFGGSYAILVPFCSICTGNRWQGMDVRNNLNSLLTLVFWSLNLSQSASKLTSQSSNKWQLHKMTQLPSLAPRWIACTALSSDPLPRESSRMFFSFS